MDYEHPYILVDFIGPLYNKIKRNHDTNWFIKFLINL
jgi:hypothetical protein